MDDGEWLVRAAALFDLPRPAQFGNARHCCECAEHEATLQRQDPRGIGLEELGSPAWDPLCYCSDEAFRYFFPALVRLALDPHDECYYLDQLLFHLCWDGPGNVRVRAFTTDERRFVHDFLCHLLDSRAEQIERMGDADALLQAIDIWR
ncbi:MAG: hypothetical protein HWE39_02810 [Oceanospirillaceae bacterium]|nr:hypothetical protein [Oceanospirillaceae bacterium]